MLLLLHWLQLLLLLLVLEVLLLVLEKWWLLPVHVLGPRVHLLAKRSHIGLHQILRLGRERAWLMPTRASLRRRGEPGHAWPHPQAHPLH